MFVPFACAASWGAVAQTRTIRRALRQRGRQFPLRVRRRQHT